MARGTRGQRRFTAREFRSARQGRSTPYTLPSRRLAAHDFRSAHQIRSTSYPLPSFREVLDKETHPKKFSTLDKKDWEGATCSVCMEYPHNAVLLLCSSHDKGCRPYMCATSYRYSNCLDQFKKAYTKVTSTCDVQTWHGSMGTSNVDSGAGWPSENCEISELACPLCRGQVKGWTVVEPAREYLNAKKRDCMQDDCSFVGTYKELRKHVKREHPSARPRKVDPILEQKWRRLERERERDDVISTIRSSMPGAMVMGDYVIEGNSHGSGTDDDGDSDEGDGDYEVGIGDTNFFDMLLLMQVLGTAGNTRLRRLERGYHRIGNEEVVGRITDTAAVGGVIASEGDDDDDDEDEDDESPVGRRRRGRVLERGRSERRQIRRNQQRSVIDVT